MNFLGKIANFFQCLIYFQILWYSCQRFISIRNRFIAIVYLYKGIFKSIYNTFLISVKMVDINHNLNINIRIYWTKLIIKIKQKKLPLWHLFQYVVYSFLLSMMLRNWKSNDSFFVNCFFFWELLSTKILTFSINVYTLLYNFKLSISYTIIIDYVNFVRWNEKCQI